jgi:probable HAF family extracellular repeat protein
MKTRTSNLRVTFAVLLMIVAVSSLSAAQQYTVTDLGTLSLGGVSGGLALNNKGAVVGFGSVVDGNDHAFLWTSSAGMSDLGVLSGYTGSIAQSINDYGEVVGWCNGAKGVEAFFWRKDAGMFGLGALGGTGSIAYGINNSHQVVGEASLPGNKAEHAFLWAPSKGMQDLGTLGGDSSVAYGINDVGQVIGFSFLADNSTFHAFIWSSSGGMQDLGTLGGSDSQALGINSFGQVVGWSSPPSNGQVPIVYAKNTGMHPIGAGSGWLTSVNRANQAVGILNTSPQSAFIWSPTQGVQNLASFFSGTSGANGINNLGQIVVTAFVSTNTAHAFLMTPRE